MTHQERQGEDRRLTTWQDKIVLSAISAPTLGPVGKAILEAYFGEIKEQSLALVGKITINPDEISYNAVLTKAGIPLNPETNFSMGEILSALPSFDAEKISEIEARYGRLYPAATADILLIARFLLLEEGTNIGHIKLGREVFAGTTSASFNEYSLGPVWGGRTDIIKPLAQVAANANATNVASAAHVMIKKVLAPAAAGFFSLTDRVAFYKHILDGMISLVGTHDMGVAAFFKEIERLTAIAQFTDGDWALEDLASTPDMYVNEYDSSGVTLLLVKRGDGPHGRGLYLMFASTKASEPEKHYAPFYFWPENPEHAGPYHEQHYSGVTLGIFDQIKKMADAQLPKDGDGYTLLRDVSPYNLHIRALAVLPGGVIAQHDSNIESMAIQANAVAVEDDNAPAQYVYKYGDGGGLWALDANGGELGLESVELENAIVDCFFQNHPQEEEGVVRFNLQYSDGTPVEVAEEAGFFTVRCLHETPVPHTKLVQLLGHYEKIVQPITIEYPVAPGATAVES